MTDEVPADLLDYNVYVLDARGRIQARRRLHAASDECAVWVFAQLDLGRPAELWRRGRRIAAVSKAGETRRFQGAGHEGPAVSPLRLPARRVDPARD